MADRSRSPAHRCHWGARVRGARFSIDLLGEEEKESSSLEANLGQARGAAMAGDGDAVNSGPMLEIRELWRRVRNLENDLEVIMTNVGELVEFAAIAQRRFRVIRPQRRR